MHSEFHSLSKHEMGREREEGKRLARCICPLSKSTVKSLSRPKWLRGYIHGPPEILYIKLYMDVFEQTEITNSLKDTGGRRSRVQ